MITNEMVDTVKMIKWYESEMHKRAKISQLLKIRVAEVVRTKKRAARKRAKAIQRQILLAQESANVTDSATPAPPVDPKLQDEFESIMRSLQSNQHIVDDLFQSLSEEEMAIIRPFLR